MRIGVDANSFQKNLAGTGRYARNLIKNLQMISPETEYIFFGHRRKTILDQKKKSPLFLRLGRGGGEFLWTQGYLPYKLKKAGVDIFFSPHYVLPLFNPCPSVVAILDVSFKLYPETGDWLYNSYLNFFLSHVLKKATKIVTISENSKRDLLSFFPIPPEKVEVIYLAADPSFHPVDDDRLLAKVREKYRIKGPFILNVNVLEPRKNIPSLLSAYALLKKSKICPHRLVIAGGKAWGYQKIFEQVIDLHLENDVLFVGHVPDEDLNVLYNLADLFVFPTLYEGFGLPVLEAMACGCPVIASRCASLPEVVGDAGILFDPFDVKGLASLIEQVLTHRNLWEELREKSLRRVQLFSWTKAATQTKELFENIYREKTWAKRSASTSIF